MSIILETTLGDITIDLFTEERPRTCLNFLKLCKMKYYNYCLFHNVQRNFIAQTGDPTKTGKGGESIFLKLYGEQARYFEGEVKPRLKHKKIGTVSMANNGDDMYGSQFFITTGEDLDYLDSGHVIFGEVAEGFEVLTKINESICDETHRPYKDIRINHTVVLEDPFDDPEGLEFPDKSPEPTQDQLQSDRIGADEEIDDTKGKSLEELREEIKDKEAKARAQILEMVGDLPTAEVRPPDNVLFVCKLNPVTTDEDLEIIFSRFGIIKSCEVIRDHKTEESLQYAFIEFEKPKDCENAYFKMDNVLIDDRRIHVDFSQSVAKLKLKWKKGADGNKKEESKESTEKFIIKNKTSGDDKYNMVFDDGQGSNQKEHKSKERKKEKEKHGGKKRSRSRSRNRSKSPSYRPIKQRDDRREKERRQDREVEERDYRKEKPKYYAREREERDSDRNRYRERDSRYK